MYIYAIEHRAASVYDLCMVRSCWTMEPHLALLDELLGLLVDVVSFRAASAWSTRQAVDGGPGDQVVDLDLGHLLNCHLPAGTGGRSSWVLIAPTKHLLRRSFLIPV